MGKTDKAMGVDYAYEWHAAKFKNVDFLFVAPRHCMIRIGQADKGEHFHVPIRTECTRTIGPDGKDLYSAACKLTVIISQTRQLRAAVGSKKSAQEGKHDRLAAIIHESDPAPFCVR